ncbi:hypothetical protein Mapa_000544 [Marchantia paleacea]|nr:hypothetical protein Mapa_000544 [Marchantia paleacea]
MMRSVFGKHQIRLVLENVTSCVGNLYAGRQVAACSSEGARARADAHLPSRGAEVEPGRARDGSRVLGECEIVHEGNEPDVWLFQRHQLARAVTD